MPMEIRNTKILKLRIKQIDWRLPLAALFVCIALSAYMYFILPSGKSINHTATVISTAVTHGYGTQGQVATIKLSNGKTVQAFNKTSKPVISGQNVQVTERLGNANTSRFYINK